MNIQLEDQIGEIVAHDYRTAAVFKANGIDFCCRGHRTLRDALAEKGLSAEDMMDELKGIHEVEKDLPIDDSHWKPQNLIAHIIERHHGYIRQQIPVITAYLEQIHKAHGKNQPALEEIKNLFIEDAQDLMSHMEAEETIVFPMILDLASRPGDVTSPSCVPLQFFQQMIAAMEHDHENEGNRWQKISELTQDYQLQFGCNVAHVTFSLLKEYYNDLQLHIHLENNILFPGAMDLKNEKIKAQQS